MNVSGAGLIAWLLGSMNPRCHVCVDHTMDIQGVDCANGRLTSILIIVFVPVSHQDDWSQGRVVVVSVRFC